MSKTPTTPPNDLRALITEALHAYELAQATRIQMERAAQQKHKQGLATAESARQAATQQLDAEHRQDEIQASAEQERIGHLLAIIQEVEQAAHDLLHKAGFAYIVGAPLSVDSKIARVRRTDESIAAAFAAAQLASANVRADLLRLARTFIDAGHWEEARRVLQLLLSDLKSTWYVDANNLLCETYYIPAVAALKSQDWIGARQGFEAVLKVNPAYRDATVLLRESYIRPAELALKTQRWDEVRHHTEAWLSIPKNKNDVDARKLLLQAYLHIAQAILNTAKFEEACVLIQNWLKTYGENLALEQLLCEAYYQLGLQAVKAQAWSQVVDHLLAIFQIAPDYKDIKDWVRHYPLPPWRIGQIGCVGILQHSESVWSISFSPDGRVLASANGGALHLWDLASQKLICAQTTPSTEGGTGLISFDFFSIFSMNFRNNESIEGLCTDGHTSHWFVFETTSKQFSIRRADRAQSSEKPIFVESRYPVRYEYRKGELVIENEKKQAMVILEHSGGITAVAISPDNTLLATAGEDGTVRLWGRKM